MTRLLSDATSARQCATPPRPIPSRARFYALVALGALMSGTTGCESMQRLRRFFKPEDARAGDASLRVTVKPAAGLTAALDGANLGSESPLEAEGLSPGQHVLSVTAPNHHPFTVAFSLAEHQALHVPVWLRPRPATPEASKGERPLRPPEPMEAPPAAPAAALPDGVPPITLQVAGQPELTVQLDSAAVAGKLVKLERVSGSITVGSARLTYRIASAGLLELAIPDDRAQWFKDGEATEPGATFFLHKGTVRLEQVAPNGDGQLLLLRREP